MAIRAAGGTRSKGTVRSFWRSSRLMMLYMPPYWTTSLGKLVYTPTITEQLAVYPIRSLTEVSGGILANYTGMDEVLSQQAFSPGWAG